MSGVVLKVPMLMDDWSHILVCDKYSGEQRTAVGSVIRSFQADLLQLSKEIEERNKTRRHKFESFNPIYLESSVSV